jgi:2-dehydro-3-deoxyglucarate aldolase
MGSWITLSHPAIAEIMVASGFDWLAVDLEHSVISLREAEELIRVISLGGCSPLVRLTSNNPDQIKRVMDSGAHGLIVPNINSAEEATRAIRAMKYPPSGIRGVGLARAQAYGNSLPEYLQWLERDSVLIVQIESITAVENIDEIFSLTGVDGFIIGPYDLSASMGIPGEFKDPRFEEAIKGIRVAAQKFNLCGGIHIIEPSISSLKERIDEGYRFIAYSLDIRMLDVSCRDVSQFRKKQGI